MPTKAPVLSPVSATNWSGVYVGAAVGYTSADLHLDGCTGICVEGTARGLTADVHAGINWHLPNNLVVGLFGTLPFWGPDATLTVFPGGEFYMKPRFIGLLGGRLGYALGNFLPYVHGGFAVATVKASSNFLPTTQTNTHTGYSLGAGGEYALSPNWSVDARYTFTHLGRETYDLGGGPVQWSTDAHSFGVGVNYRFASWR